MLACQILIEPGDNVWVNADVLMTHDVCGPGTIGVFKREFGKNAKVWDRNKVVIIPDHYIFTADSRSNRNVDILRDFVKEQAITYFYDVIDDPNGHWVFDPSKGNLKRQYGSNYAGVCHTALPAKGHTRPGEILFGTDSHTCMAGAFNEFATGIGNTDAGFVLGTGKLLLKRINHAFASLTSDITFEQLGVLYFISRGKGKDIIQQDIAEMMDKTKSAILRSIDILEKKRFVKRLSDPGDRRKNVIELTESGKNIIGEMHKRFLEQDTVLKKGLGKEELNKCLSVLSKVQDKCK